jgi:hypothetical protein
MPSKAAVHILSKQAGGLPLNLSVLKLSLDAFADVQLQHALPGFTEPESDMSCRDSSLLLRDACKFKFRNSEVGVVHSEIPRFEHHVSATQRA